MAPKPRKIQGKCHYRKEYTNDFPWIQPVPTDSYSVKCTLCNITFGLSNMGRQSITSHAKGKKHKRNLGTVSSTLTIKDAFQKSTVPAAAKQKANPQDSVGSIRSSKATQRVTPPPQDQTSHHEKQVLVTNYLNKEQILESEIIWTLYEVSRHHSLRDIETSIAIIQRVCPDSVIAQKLQLSKSKASCMIGFGLKNFFQKELLESILNNSMPMLVIGFDESKNRINKLQQMDIMIRFWNELKNEVTTRYFTSAFLGSCKAIDLLKAFEDSIPTAILKRVIQISMDGPNVNLKFRNDFQAVLPEYDCDKILIDLGTCGLHVLHNVFKAGIKEVDWQIVEFLRALHNIFEYSSPRRSKFSELTGCKLFPKSFCSVRWLENGSASERALEILSHIIDYVEKVSKTDEESKSKSSTSKSSTSKSLASKSSTSKSSTSKSSISKSSTSESSSSKNSTSKNLTSKSSISKSSASISSTSKSSTSENSKSKNSASKSFDTVQDIISDKLLRAKLTFFQSFSNDVEPFLTEFQSNDPKVPFLFEQLSLLYLSILKRIVKPDILKNHEKNVLKIDLNDESNLLDESEVQLSIATSVALKCIGTVSEDDRRKFKKECRTVYKVFLLKIAEKSPLNYAIVKGLSCLDPLIAVDKYVSHKRITLALEKFVKNRIMVGSTADKVLKEFTEIMGFTVIRQKCRAYKRNESRLDHFWIAILADLGFEKYPNFLQFVKIVMILSHGNAALERSFSVNKECLVENLTENSLIARRLICDAITSMTTPLNEYVISKEMKQESKNSTMNYKRSLAEKKQRDDNAIKEKQALKRKAAQLCELEEKKQKLNEESLNIEKQILVLKTS